MAEKLKEGVPVSGEEFSIDRDWAQERVRALVGSPGDLPVALGEFLDLAAGGEGGNQVPNQASFAQIRPKYRDICCTVAGLNQPWLTAFLRWLGVEGDQVERGGGMHLGIKKVCVAADFDGPGTEGFFRIRERLELAFPDIEVFGIHELLPPEARELALPYDRDAFAPDGRYFKQKQDMNDLLRMPEMEEYRYRPPA